MSHLHHIIPKHMGGTDDPDNLIKLSIEEHAEASKQAAAGFVHPSNKQKTHLGAG